MCGEHFGVGIGVAAVRMIIGGGMLPLPSRCPFGVTASEYIFISGEKGRENTRWMLSYSYRNHSSEWTLLLGSSRNSAKWRWNVVGNKITPTMLKGIRQMSQPFKRSSALPGLGTRCPPKEASFVHCFLGFREWSYSSGELGESFQGKDIKDCLNSP